MGYSLNRPYWSLNFWLKNSSHYRFKWAFLCDNVWRVHASNVVQYYFDFPERGFQYSIMHYFRVPRHNQSVITTQIWQSTSAIAVKNCILGILFMRHVFISHHWVSIVKSLCWLIRIPLSEQEKMLDSLSSRVEAEHNKLTAEIRAKDQTISSVQQQADKQTKLATEFETRLNDSNKVHSYLILWYQLSIPMYWHVSLCVNYVSACPCC